MARRMGRKTDLTSEIEDKIVTAVKSGAPLEVSAQAMGVAPNTFWEWMARGEGKDPDRPQTPLYANFAKRVRAAEAEAHLLTVGEVRRAVLRGNVQASLGWLRMRWPRHYAERTEISGPDGKAVPLRIQGLLEGMTDDDLNELAARLASAGPGRSGAGSSEGGPED